MEQRWQAEQAANLTHNTMQYNTIRTYNLFESCQRFLADASFSDVEQSPLATNMESLVKF